jgi:hypothetical protein
VTTGPSTMLAQKFAPQHSHLHKILIIDDNISGDMFPNEDTNTKRFIIGQLKWIAIFILIWIGISFVIPFPFSLPVVVGLFILIGYLIRKRALRKQENNRESTSSEEFHNLNSKTSTVFCIYCGNERDSTGEFCSRCGRQNSLNIKICHKCRSYMSSDSQFCANCGQKFEDRSNPVHGSSLL